MSSATEFEAAHQAHVKGDYAKAERLYAALRLSMPYQANHNLGLVRLAQGKFKAAEEAFTAALAAKPGDPRPAYSIGQLKLAEGDYPRGFELVENRRQILGMMRQPATSAPEWMGESLAGKRLLVVGEQGFGDQIMFARFIAPLAAQGARIVFSAPAVLHGLFRSLPCELVTPDGEAEVACDAWVYLGTLPLRLGVRLDTLPPPAALSVEPAPAAAGSGVVPRGGTVFDNDRRRSLFGKDEQRLLALGRDLRPEATGAASFAETAGIVAGLERVISVDTAVAHLAASMGKPTWVLVAAQTDWRWLRGRNDSPWYPSVRLFRQRVTGDWGPVLRQVETALGR